jgi:hypothetical protein
MRFNASCFSVFFVLLISSSTANSLNKDTLNSKVSFFVQSGIFFGKTTNEYWKCSNTNTSAQKQNFKLDFNVDYQFSFFCIINTKWLIGLGSFADHFRYHELYGFTVATYAKPPPYHVQYYSAYHAYYYWGNGVTVGYRQLLNKFFYVDYSLTYKYYYWKSWARDRSPISEIPFPFFGIKNGNYSGITASISLGIKSEKRTSFFISPVYKRILFEYEFVNDVNGNSYKMHRASLGLNFGLCINFGGKL